MTWYLTILPFLLNFMCCMSEFSHCRGILFKSTKWINQVVTHLTLGGTQIESQEGSVYPY